MIFHITAYSDFMLYKGTTTTLISFPGPFFPTKTNDLGTNDLFVDAVGTKPALIVEVCMWLAWRLGLHRHCKLA